MQLVMHQHRVCCQEVCSTLQMLDLTQIRKLVSVDQKLTEHFHSDLFDDVFMCGYHDINGR